MVGSFYVSIKLFFTDFFETMTDTVEFKKHNRELWEFFNSPDWGFLRIFSVAYVALLGGLILMSICLPINKGISFIRLISGIFSSFTILSLIGIATFLANTGFFPAQKRYDRTEERWHDVKDAHGNVITHFSILTLSGVIMLSVYFLPMILRPIDFLFNA